MLLRIRSYNPYPFLSLFVSLALRSSLTPFSLSCLVETGSELKKQLAEVCFQSLLLFVFVIIVMRIHHILYLFGVAVWLLGHGIGRNRVGEKGGSAGAGSPALSYAPHSCLQHGAHTVSSG
jgi:hypothetical protein